MPTATSIFGREATGPAIVVPDAAAASSARAGAHSNAAATAASAVAPARNRSGPNTTAQF
jgi:hypothetical protein